MKILHLTLKKKWFDKIASGRKTHEFRQVKPYWTKRLEGKVFDVIRFRNGYSASAPVMLVEFTGLSKRTFKKTDLYVVHLGKLLTGPAATH